MPKVSNQISWKIFLSDYHVFTSRFVSEWGRAKKRGGGWMFERENKLWARERERKGKYRIYLCPMQGEWKWWVVGGGGEKANERERKSERKNNNSQLKRGKLSLYIFLIFSDGLVWREKEKIDSILGASSLSSSCSLKKIFFPFTRS